MTPMPPMFLLGFGTGTLCGAVLVLLVGAALAILHVRRQRRVLG